jgi:A/G-specific adenine glycosylase
LPPKPFPRVQAPLQTRRVSDQRVATARRNLLAWYAQNGRKFSWRRLRASCYEQIVSEVLLQRTRAESVDAVIGHFLERYPDWEALATAGRDDLREFLRPLGLWQRRADSLTRLACAVVTLEGKFPSSRVELEQLPAVGQYVASAILMFVHGQPEALLDTNMSRVLERYFGPRDLVDIRYDPYLQALARRFVTYGSGREINWAVLDLGATICKAREPACEQCPLARGCLTGKRLLADRASAESTARSLRRRGPAVRATSKR